MSWASSSSRIVSSRISSRLLLKRGDFGIKCRDFFVWNAVSPFIKLVRLVKFNFTFGLKVGFGEVLVVEGYTGSWSVFVIVAYDTWLLVVVNESPRVPVLVLFIIIEIAFL